ncbi:fumarylacetoacetase [Ottowia thiooxydans]|uniref:fumarylacetoacetase n=1 Tax=Ottowia thiooxydans TaxID=219182 RepID=UPI0003F766DB|nr:fumarylacetoacetase [Ottowia thiooxydans]
MSKRIDACDQTHDPVLSSWVESSVGHGAFPIQNLPMGVFSEDGRTRIAVAIGDELVDLRAAADAGFLAQLPERAQQAARATTLNDWMALPASARTQLRAIVSDLLSASSEAGHGARAARASLLRQQEKVEMLLPAEVGDYTDFYAGIHHAMNCGMIFRPEQPLQPNYKHLPVAYHGRASTLRPSGTPVRRPRSQVRDESAHEPRPRLQHTSRLDYEMELALWIGPGNDLAQSIDIRDAAGHVAGYGLLNDWSARDIQAWESLPLGPFQGKNFMTSLSPWVVTSDAMVPFRSPRMPRDAQDPRPLAYLHDDEDESRGGIDIALRVYLLTRAMREQGAEACLLSEGRSTALWWTPAQMVTHHTVGGCNLRPGDLLGTGTISMAQGKDCGCLLEMTEGGRRPIHLPNGEVRAFLEDGDEVVMRGECRRDGFVSIGFGECRGTVVG